MYDSNKSRRQFLKYLSHCTLACTVPTLLSSCRKKSKAKTSIIYFYGTGTLDINERGWAKALKDIGVDVRFTDNRNDTGPVIAQMISGTAQKDYDLGGLQGGAERELFEADTILPWDLNKIPNWEYIWDIAKKIPYARFEDKQLGLPIALNADSIIYLPDKIRDVSGYESGIVHSYSIIFDEKFKGRVSMEDAWINSVIFAAIYLKENHYMAINDPGDLSESELKDVMDFLISYKKKGQFRKFWRGWEQGVDLLSSGEVVAMTGWEPIVYELCRRNINAVYANPKEGYEGWSNDLLLHSGVKDKNVYHVAHMVANWLYSGFYGCQLATLRGYAVPSDKMIDYANNTIDFDSKKIESLAKHVQDKFKRDGGAIYWQNVRPKNYRLYEEWWTKLRQA